MATYNSSTINRDGFARGPGVYPVSVVGTINIASNTTIGSGAPDVLNICYIPNNCFIKSVTLGFPALGTSLGLKLLDTLASPTTYIAAITQAAAGGVVTFANMAAGDTPKLGTMYAATARSIGTTGAAVVVWASGVKLQLSCITSGAATTGASAVNVTYIVEFVPVYDAGV